MDSGNKTVAAREIFLHSTWLAGKKKDEMDAQTKEPE